jgi:outer membrane protein OmpA-like peptidoglycan-associated protein
MLILYASVSQGQHRYEVRSLKDINTSSREYGAKPYKNGIVFSSTKRAKGFNNFYNERTLEPISNIFYAESKEGNKYYNPELIPFNEADVADVGSFDFFNDTAIIFTKSYSTPNGPMLGLFESSLVDSVWTEPMPFKYNSDEYHIAHPCFSLDGNTIYFASNLPSTFGGADLFKCERKKDGWSKPINLGPLVNSASSELFPTIHFDGRLSFSSMRSGTFGGLDLYFADLDSLEKKGVQHYTAPINSEADDFSIYFSADYESGMLSTNREGNDDVFLIKMTQPFFEFAPLQVENQRCFIFYDEEDENVGNLPLQYSWTFGDGSPAVRGLEVEHCFKSAGSFEVNLNIVDTLTNDIFFSKASYIQEILDLEQPYISISDTVQVNEQIQFDATQTFLPSFKIKSYHWFINDSIYLEGDTVNYTFEKEGLYEILLGLRSDPDSLTGLVSQRAVTKMVYATNIVKEELPLENEPAVASVNNEIVNAPVDNPFVYGVEILTASTKQSIEDPYFEKASEKYPISEIYSDADSTYSYSVGQANSLDQVYPIYSYLKSQDYKEAVVKKYDKKSVIDLSDLNDVSEEDLENMILRSSAILFEKNKYTVDSSSYELLNKVTDLMVKFPKVKLKISAHTDNTGSDSYNEKLSQKRAESVMTFLISKGIDASRFSCVGLGSKYPIQDNLSEANRKLNRRVEFETMLDNE